MANFFKSDLVIDTLNTNGDVTIDGNLTVNGDTTTVSTTNTVVSDKLIELANGTSTGADSGIIIERGSTGNNAAIIWDESADTFVVGTTTATGASTGDLSVTDGALKAGSLDISGNVDVDGTLETDALTIDGVTLSETIADTVGAMVTSNTESGITVAYQDADNTLDFTVSTLNQDTSGTAAIATTVTCADESSDTSCFVGYVTAATGDLGVKTGSNLTFNSSNGTLGATEFSGGGVGITGLNGTQVTSGTVAAARVATLNQDTTGTAAIATTVTVADESSDTSCNVLFTTAATGDLPPKSGTNLTFNSSNGLLTATSLAGTLTTAAQTNITSVGTIGTGTWAATDIAIAHGGTGSSTAGDARTALGVQPVAADLTALSSCQTGGAAALALLTATEVAILDGATLSTAELNYVDGVTSAIQTQLNTKGVTAGSNSITTVGTIGTGTWQGTAIASAYLDADTAHLSGTQTFTGTKTLNSFKGTGAITVTNILDEDAMGTDSDTALATQQSIKAYADTKSPVAGSSSIVTTGALNAGSITSGFTSIDVGAGAISTTGTVTTGVVNSTATAATGISLDQNFSVTDASSTVGLDIDFDKTGASTTNNTMVGLNVDMDNTTATNGTNTMVGAKLTPTLQHASAAGTTLVKGAEIVATGSGPGNTTTRALDLTATGADFNQGIFMKIDNGGPDIKMLSSADTGDFCTIATTAHGATTLTTVDDDAANADLTFTLDGSFDVTATSTSLSSDLAVAGGDVVLGASADSNNVSLTAITESGTNTAGKILTVGGGIGTGTGLPGAVIISSAIPTGSGANAQTATPVAQFDTFGVTQNFGGVAALAADTGVGEVVYFGAEDAGNSALDAGRLVILDASGNWQYADADDEATTKPLIGIALGGAVSDGILLKGFFKVDTHVTNSFAKGLPCFVSPTVGTIDFTMPTTGGQFQRVVGYGTDTTNVIYFNPSTETLPVPS